MPEERPNKVPEMNLLDKAIASVAPRWGLNRFQARANIVGMSNVYGVSSIGASNKSSLSNWATKRLSRFTEGLEREKTVDRAEDLIANDPHAVSIVEGMAVNIVGPGITVHSRPNAKILGISEDEADELKEQFEWAYKLWGRKADASDRLNDTQLQYTTILSLLGAGESCRIPVTIKDDPSRKFSMAIQSISPLRCFTPSDMMKDKTIRDGITYGKRGQPKGYWIANPKTDFYTSRLSSKDFEYKQARIGHRPGFFHTYVPKHEEQGRGKSILAPAMKFFKDLSDYLDFEVIGAIVASSFPVFIETSNPYDTAGNFGSLDKNSKGQTYQDANPGQVMYGSNYEKPHILKSDRPGNTFPAFVERILRAVGASVGMPYEAVAKDFSKTNYSSARAALLEAWRVYTFYQRWLIDGYCQPIYEMVIEEAYLRGMIKLPASGPDFYDALEAYTSAIWIPPRKGHIDPAKEIGPYIDAKNENFMTLDEIIPELTTRDAESVLIQRGKERQRERDLKIVPPDVVNKSSVLIENEKPEEKVNEENN
ncbi:phage portal protein [Candidatus Pacearchaeota archaeon]|nr:phage portal protein [Candidatus Pacearchaeota archaeon]